jgi:hypothetical protein
LTDISIDWGGLPVKDIFPQRIPDLFAGKPLVLTGRYVAAASGTIRLRGKRNGENFEREIPVTFSANPATPIVLPTLWARQKVDDLMSQDWVGAQRGQPRADVKDAVTDLGLEYRMMTQYTSFVAVEEQVVTDSGKPRTVQVPVEMPEGVSYEGVFGGSGPQAPPPAMMMSTITVNQTVAVQTMNATVDGAVLEKSAPHRRDKFKDNGRKAPLGDRKRMESKFHPALLAVWDCWKKDPSNCKLLHDGKVKVQIWLTNDTPEARAELKALGFVQAPDSKAPVGEIPVSQLEALGTLTEVKFVGLAK